MFEFVDLPVLVLTGRFAAARLYASGRGSWTAAFVFLPNFRVPL